MDSKLTPGVWLKFSGRSNLLWQIAAPLFLIVFILTIQFYDLKQSREQQLETTRLSARNLGSALAVSISNSLQNIDLTLLSAADRLGERNSPADFDKQKLEAQLLDLQRRIPPLNLLGVANASGAVIFGLKSSDAKKINLANHAYFKYLIANPQAGMVISEPTVGLITKKWILICARRFNFSNGQFGGVVFSSILLEGLNERLSGKELKLGDNDVFILRDLESKVIVRYAHRKQDMRYTGVKVARPELDLFYRAGTVSGFFTANSVIDKEERSYYYQRIGDLPLSLAVGLSLNDALSNWRIEAIKSGICTLIFILALGASFFYIYREQAKKLIVIKDLESTRNRLLEAVKFNEAILFNSPLPISVYSADGQCVKANDALVTLVGTTREVLLKQNFNSITAWKKNGVYDTCLTALSERCAQQLEVDMKTMSGQRLHTHFHISPVQLNNENHLLIQIVDLSEIKMVTKKLDSILQSMNEGVHVIDENGLILLENDAAMAMFGWEGQQMTGLHAHATIHHHHADHAEFPVEDCPIYASLLDGKVRHVEDDVFWRKDGTCFPVEYTATPMFLSQGTKHAITVVFRDITYRKQLEGELRKQATHDALTGLPNRRLLMDRIGQAIIFNKRQNVHSAVLFLDLNKFKELNDTFGHDIGDQLLIKVARRLQEVVRESDTVARFGGDEFVVLLLGLHDQLIQAREYVDFVAGKVRQTLSDECILGKIRYQCSASIGIKLFFDESDPDQILKAADVAMYREKKEGII